MLANRREWGPDWGLCVQAGYELAGRYVLEQLLGQGAVGEVWRAADRELDRLVAVKVIRERVADPKLAAGLLAEARIAGRLQHRASRWCTTPGWIRASRSS
jgi:serine/threonine protein kinase